MTDKKDSSPKDAGKAGESLAGKRPHATLDLRATEVKVTETAAAKPEAAGSTAAAAAKAAEPAKPATAAAADKANADPKAQVNDPKAQVKMAEPAKPAAASGPSARPAAQAPQTASGRGRLWSHLAAGLAGGLVVLFGGDRIAALIGKPDPAADLRQAAAALQGRIATLEQGAKEPRPAPELAAKLTETANRLAKLEETNQKLAALAEAQAKLEGEASALAQKIDEQSAGRADAERLGKMEERLGLIAAAAETDPDKGRVGGLAAVTGKMSDLEANVANQMSELRKGVLAEVETRLGEAAAAGEAARTGTQRIDREVGSLRTETARLSQRVEDQKAESDRLAATIQVVQEDTANLNSALGGLRTTVDSQLSSVARPADVASAVMPLTAKVADLEKGLSSVIKSEDERRSSAERIVVSLELADLKRALDRGGSFAAEFDAVSKSSAGKIDLKSLARYKDTGVKSLAELERDFRPVMHAILDADAEPAEASVLDRLKAGALSVVRVRKVAHDADDKSTEAVIGRMEAALKEGRLGDVLTAAKDLPDKAAGPAASWLADVEARNAVDKAVATVEGELKTLLGRGASGPTGTESATPDTLQN